MIPAGRTAADDKKAAELFGWSTGGYRNKKVWLQFPPSVKPLHHPGARARFYDLEQLTVQVDNMKAEEGAKQEIPLLPRNPQILKEGTELPTLKKGVHLAEGDLLDRDEAFAALAALPAEDRPSWTYWLRLIAPASGGAKTKGPQAVDVEGVRFWKYGTLTEWDAKREKRGAPQPGRPVGVKEAGPRKPRADFQERMETARRLLEENPALTNRELAEELKVTERTAERIRATLRDS